MLYSIPWYVVLFQSIPEMFLLIILGFKLFNIDVNFKKTLLVSLLISIIVYIVRKFASVYGFHTVIFIFFFDSYKDNIKNEYSLLVYMYCN